MAVRAGTARPTWIRSDESPRLIDDGVNLVGIRLILSLEAENAVLAARISQLTAEGD